MFIQFYDYEYSKVIFLCSTPGLRNNGNLYQKLFTKIYSTESDIRHDA